MLLSSIPTCTCNPKIKLLLAACCNSFNIAWYLDWSDTKRGHGIKVRVWVKEIDWRKSSIDCTRKESASSKEKSEIVSYEWTQKRTVYSVHHFAEWKYNLLQRRTLEKTSSSDPPVPRLMCRENCESIKYQIDFKMSARCSLDIKQLDTKRWAEKSRWQGPA